MNEFFELIRDPRIAEELILAMADVVHEKRQLEDEVRELSVYRKKYEDLFNEYVRGADRRSMNVLEAALAGAEIASRGAVNA